MRVDKRDVFWYDSAVNFSSGIEHIKNVAYLFKSLLYNRAGKGRSRIIEL